MWRFDNRTVPDVRTELPGPNGRALLERDQKFVSPSYTPMYPLFVARGSGCVIEDVDGNLFLDFTAGIAVTATGHCHPEVVAAIKDQAEKLIHMSGTDFYYEPQIALAQRLAEMSPGPSPKRVFFTNSGAEALEAALKLSRWHTQRSRVIAFFGAFHGRTYGAMSLSASKLVHRRGFSPLVPDIHHVPYPFVRGPLPVTSAQTDCESRECSGCAMPFPADTFPNQQTTDNGQQTTCDMVKMIEETVLKRTAPPEEVAAIFIEPIQGEGGYRIAPPGCLPALRKLCDKHGILLVFDEVQSGMGRTGKLFACEHWGVEPDIICSAKGIASGMPLGAIIARDTVMDWPSGSHASTFGGNPVSCQASLATLDLLERGYMKNAHERGEQLRAGLGELTERYDCLADVRGLGLMMAVDVVKDDGSADPKGRDAIVQTAFQHGLLLLGCGETGIRFCPPLCVTAAEVETCVRLLDEILAERGEVVGV